MNSCQHPFPHCHGLPTLAEVEITSACNAACGFCPREVFKPSLFMTLAIYKRVITRLADDRITNIKLVGFGEPTLHPNLIEFLEIAQDAGISPILNTNGTLIHKWGAARLLEVCDEIIISLHTLRPGLYRELIGLDALPTVLENLENLRAANHNAGKRLTIYFVATAVNYTELEQVRKISTGFKLVVSGCTNRTIPNFASKLRDEALNQTLNAYPKISCGDVCGYAESALVIAADGQYLRCTNDVYRNSALGTVYEKPARTVFNEILDRFQKGAFAELCRTCDNFGGENNSLVE